VPAGGKFIKRKWLKYYKDVSYESRDRLIISWDIALTEAENGDYAAGVVLLNRGQTFYVLEVARGRFPFDTLKRRIVEMGQRFPRAALLIEKSPISLGLIQALTEQHVNVVPITPEKDKNSRVISQSDLFEGGSI